MKVLIASGIYPPDIGGPATYSRLIAQEFIKRRIGVFLVCYSDKKEEPTDKEDNFKIIRIARNRNSLFRFLSYAWNLFKLARHCCVVYAQGPLSAGLPALVVAKVLRKKFIIKIVGDYAWEQGVNRFGVKDLIEEFQIKRYGRRIEWLRKIQKFVVKRAGRIVVPSKFLKGVVKGWGIKDEKIHVIYNAGPEIDKILDLAPKQGLKGDILISAGRLEPWKGMVALVEIMPDLLQKNANFRLFIAGDGPLMGPLKLKIKNLNLEGKAILLGRVSKDELMSYLKASKIFVLNTGYEGLPHVILEATACGLPIITTNVCGNPEVVENNYNGFLVEHNNKEQLKNAILKAWNSRDLREKFVKNGKEILKKFNRERMINETIEILKT